MIDLTAHSRYKGPLNVDLNEISTNMIPFPNLNYLTINTTLINKQHLRTAFHETFTKSLISTIDPTMGVFITAGALLRSKTHDLHQLRDAISHTKKSMKFPLWNLDGWKIGVTRNTGFSKYDSVMSLTNNTQVSNFLDLNLNRFGNIFKRKAHLQQVKIEKSEKSEKKLKKVKNRGTHEKKNVEKVKKRKRGVVSNSLFCT